MERVARARGRGAAWYEWVSAAFLRAYLERPATLSCPADPDELALLLDASLLEKALYELAYELNNRPTWVPIAPERPARPAGRSGLEAVRPPRLRRLSWRRSG